MPWLTGNVVDPGYTCRTLRIPGDLFFLEAVSGALRELTFEYNWERFGEIEPSEAVEAALVMLDAYFESDCMIGTIMPYASFDPPSNCLRCDGTVYDRVDYPDLYDRLDPHWQVSPTQFQLPDLRNRFVYGVGTADPGDTGGLSRVGLTVSEMPTHDHTTQPHSHTDAGHTHTEIIAVAGVINGGLEAPAPASSPAPAVTGIGYANIQPATVTVDAAGSGETHENMPPWLALNWCIVAR